MKRFLYFIFRYFFRVKVRGEFPKTFSKLIIIANHQSLLDGLLLGAFLPIRPVFIVNTHAALKPLARFFLSFGNYLVVDPLNPMAIKKVIRLVQSNHPVMIFPEGRISTTGKLMKIYEGVSMIASQSGAMILPITIDGAQWSQFSGVQKDKRQRWFPKITLNYGEPLMWQDIPLSTPHEKRLYGSEIILRLLQKNLVNHSIPETLNEVFGRAYKRHGYDYSIFQDHEGKESTYQDLAKMLFAIKIAINNTKSKGPIGVLLPNSVVTIASLLAITSLERVIVFLPYNGGRSTIEHAINLMGIELLLTSRTFLQKAKIEEILPSKFSYERLDVEDLVNKLRWYEKLWVMFQSRFPLFWSTVRGNPHKEAVVLLTSGSEAHPKGVVHTHASLLSNLQQIDSVLDISPNEILFNPLPLFHSFGLTVGALFPLFNGIKTILYPSPLHYHVIPEIVYDQSCTILLGTNTFLNHYARHAHPYDFHSLRYVIAGGEKLTGSVEKIWMEKFGLRILEGYGTTETAPVLSVNTAMAYQRGSVGKLLPEIEYAIEKIEGLSNGGILHVKGPNIMKGYWNKEIQGALFPEASIFGKDWYNTGDIVEINPQGYIAIKGRFKRAAKIGGELISMESIEYLVSSHSITFEHASIISVDDTGKENIYLITTDYELDRHQIREWILEEGQSLMLLPKKIIHIKEMPHLPSGKIDYRNLSENI